MQQGAYRVKETVYAEGRVHQQDLAVAVSWVQQEVLGSSQ